MLFRRTLLWIVRALAAAGIALLLALTIGGLVFFGAARRAWTLSDMEERGVKIRYWHEYDEKQDPLPPYLRKALGNQWWSEPRNVNYTRFNGRKRAPTLSDLQLFCSLVGKFHQLRHFEIESEHFTCDLIQDWPTLAEIEYLQVASPRLTDKDLEIIARMTALDLLRIKSANITNHGIRHLTKLPRLKTLRLSAVQISVSDSSPMETFPELTNLSISSSPGFNDATARTWGPLPKLRDLTLTNTTIGDQGLAHLLQDTRPAWIMVEGGLVSADSLPELARHNPQWLGLSKLRVTDEAIAALAGHQVSHLVLNRTEVTDAALEAISKINGLEHLELSDTNITGPGIVDLQKVSSLYNLSLDGCALSRQAITDVAKLKCSDLWFNRTPMDDEQILLFADHDDLRQLHVSETKVTAAGVQAFCEARKRHFQTTGKKDELWLSCDFPDVVSKYYSR